MSNERSSVVEMIRLLCEQAFDTSKSALAGGFLTSPDGLISDLFLLSYTVSLSLSKGRSTTQDIEPQYDPKNDKAAVILGMGSLGYSTKIGRHSRLGLGLGLLL